MTTDISCISSTQFVSAAKPSKLIHNLRYYRSYGICNTSVIITQKIIKGKLNQHHKLSAVINLSN